MSNKKNVRNVLLYLGIPIIFIVTIIIVSMTTKQVDKKTYDEMYNLIMNDKVSEYSLNLYNGELKYTLRADGKTYKYTVADPAIFYEDVHKAVIAKNQALLTDDDKSNDKNVIKYDYQILDDAYWLLTTNGYKIVKK